MRVIVFWVLCVTPLVSVADELSDIKQVVTEAYDMIWAGLETDAIDIYHTNDFTLLNDGEEVWSNFDVVIYLNRVKNLQSKTMEKVNSFEFLEHKIYNEFAWVTFYNTRLSNDATSTVSKTIWLESAFLVKQNKQWKFRLLHSTRVRNP